MPIQRNAPSCKSGICWVFDMRKILVLNGSPHRANSTTMIATNAFVNGMLSSGRYEAETVHISALNITPCRGCLSCWGRTEGECVIKNDDIPALKEKILAADVLIASFPLYYFGIPGQFKVMMDRLLSMVMAYHGQNTPKAGEPAHTFRYPKADRRFILISGCAYNETDQVYDPILHEFDLILGKGNYLPILCPQYKTMIDNGGARVARSVAKFTAAGAEYAQNEMLSEKTVQDITRPPFSAPVYQTILENVWKRERESGDGIKETSR